MDTYIYDFKVDTTLLKDRFLLTTELDFALSGLLLTSKEESNERDRDSSIQDEWNESCRQAGAATATTTATTATGAPTRAPTTEGTAPPSTPSSL